MIPIRTLGSEYFHYDADTQTLMGSDTGTLIGLGQRVTVKLADVTPTTGGLTADLIKLDERMMPKGSASKKKAAKVARKVKRRRK